MAAISSISRIVVLDAFAEARALAFTCIELDHMSWRSECLSIRASSVAAGTVRLFVQYIRINWQQSSIQSCTMALEVSG